MELPKENLSLDSFASQTNHANIYQIGDYLVKVKFQENGASIEDRMAEYLRKLSETCF